MRVFEDQEYHVKARRRLVQGLRSKNITSKRVLNALATIPRHFFMPKTMENMAYEDRPFPIGAEQTISQPYTVAYQTQLLEIAPTDRVLEIGTGSAYQAAILALLADEVFSIERQRKLFEKNQAFSYLEAFPNLYLFYADGYEGLAEYAPYDKILITAAAPYIPPRLVDQLKPGGMMVLPFGKEKPQVMMRITKAEGDSLIEERFDHFSFVPMLEGKNG